MGLKSALHTPPPTPLHGHRRLRVPPAPPLTTASLSLLSLSLSLFLSPLSANAQECTAQGNVAIFMVYQAENPDSVFLSEDGCLAGGGRGSGCCSGAQCRVCEPNQVTSTSGQQMNWNSCVCEPCPPGSVQFREGSQECVQCPAGWYQPFQGRTECIQCPTGTFNPRVGRVEECVVCPPGTYSKSENRAYREATTKLYRGTTTTFDQSKGAISCTNCKAGEGTRVHNDEKMKCHPVLPSALEGSSPPTPHLPPSMSSSSSAQKTRACTQDHKTVRRRVFLISPDSYHSMRACIDSLVDSFGCIHDGGGGTSLHRISQLSP